MVRFKRLTCTRAVCCPEYTAKKTTAVQTSKHPEASWRILLHARKSPSLEVVCTASILTKGISGRLRSVNQAIYQLPANYKRCIYLGYSL